jgi:tetratricopeptide (TPR) repeat protein
MTPNDTLLLLTIPFFSKENILRQLASYYALAALERRDQQQYIEAKKWCEQGLAVYHNDSNLLNVLAITLLDLSEFQKAREIFADLLRTGGLDKNQIALYANNLAYADILLGQRDLMEEADKCSAQAYQSCPWIPGIKGTRGMVLIELGKLDEGLLLLKHALEGNEEANNKAMDASYIAIGEMRKGNKQAAQQYFDMAAGFNPDCPFLQRAQDELKK